MSYKTQLVKIKMKPKIKKRIQDLYDIIDTQFINIYFDGEFPKDKYDIELIVSGIPIIQVTDKGKPEGWMMYSNAFYLQCYNDLKDRHFREYMATFKIQQWWLKMYYDPRQKIIHNVMNRKYDEYGDIE
mgnify:CR=1 FL=1|jgi:hypothetical protein